MDKKRRKRAQSVGRPKSKDPRSYRVEVMFTAKELERLDAMCDYYGFTRSGMLRTAMLEKRAALPDKCGDGV